MPKKTFSHKIKYRNLRSEDPLDTLDKILQDSALILKVIIENKDFLNEKLSKERPRYVIDEWVISEAKNQHIISIISGLEIFFTDLFIDLIDEYKFEYTQFNVKLDLLDLSEILKKKLTIGHIISEQFNFQNLDKINKAFSTLLNISFIEALKQAIKTEEYRNEINFLVLKDDFYQKINEIIEIRHKCVHDIIPLNEIDVQKLDEYREYILSFCLAAYWLIETKYLRI